MIVYKSSAEIESLDRANALVVKILDALESMVAPGVSTWDLDQVSEEMARKAGARPAFKGYRGFPGSLCASINEEVIHGIPSKKRSLREGDIVSLDFGVVLDGYYGDSARTIAVGEIPEETRRLMAVTREALDRGLAQAKPGMRLSDIGHAVQSHVEQSGFSVVREFVGHGIGSSLHEDPQVPNYGEPGAGPLLKEGLVLAVEPMVNQGSPDVRILADGWTAVTVDGLPSAHFERCVAITASGPRVLGESGRG
ncbi:MAG TPA: type I methionyl aminopeptidase [Candidatus Polarisedimenticolia bacterium]|nr:type I methionyl aminopeptidase [Candidatus Polarisedimenticolia bacterium]